MLPETFDRETALDLVVNAVPLGMLVGFVLMFVLDTPYGIDPVPTAIQLTLVLVPLGALVVLSYHAAKAVEAAEAEAEAEADTEAASEAESEPEAVADAEAVAAVTDGAEGTDDGPA
jgi:hypothetical protein